MLSATRRHVSSRVDEQSHRLHSKALRSVVEGSPIVEWTPDVHVGTGSYEYLHHGGCRCIVTAQYRVKQGRVVLRGSLHIGSRGQEYLNHRHRLFECGPLEWGTASERCASDVYVDASLQQHLHHGRRVGHGRFCTTLGATRVPALAHEVQRRPMMLVAGHHVGARVHQGFHNVSIRVSRREVQGGAISC